MAEEKREKGWLVRLDDRLREPMQWLAEQEDRTPASLARHLLRQAVQSKLKASGRDAI